jgi:hypothetical protein
MAESLTAKVMAWEKERGAKFVYDGVCMIPLHLFLYLYYFPILEFGEKLCTLCFDLVFEF